jgi:hypothetical protein
MAFVSVKGGSRGGQRFFIVSEVRGEGIKIVENQGSNGDLIT